MTNGEKWIANAVKRFAALCKTRGLSLTGPFIVKPRDCYTEGHKSVIVTDKKFNSVELEFDTFSAGRVLVYDFYGNEIVLTAALFDQKTSGLFRPEKISKKQLSLAL